jgi:F-type H+-transporting ATPase subunit gamma
LLAMRPYAYKIIGILNSLKESTVDIEQHPLLRRREVKKTKILVVSSDRGLCSSFNSNIIKRAEAYIREKNLTLDNSQLSFLGKKGYEYFMRRYKNIASHVDMGNVPSYDTASEAAEKIISEYTAGDFDSLVVVYNEFKSVISQKVVVERMFPIIPEEYKDEQKNIELYVYEPNKEDLLGALIPKYVKIEIFRIMLESSTSEHAARMTAMDNATNNAVDMMKRLTLDYNRQRQAAITKELMEIVGGKEALDKG